MSGDPPALQDLQEFHHAVAVAGDMLWSTKVEAFQIIMKEGERFMMFFSLPYSGGGRKGVETKSEDEQIDKS